MHYINKTKQTAPSGAWLTSDLTNKEGEGLLRSGHGLQPIDRRIIAKHIVADFRGRHGRAHSRRRPRNRVAAQIDHGLGGLASGGKAFSEVVP